jgi:hypothetical protein
LGRIQRPVTPLGRALYAATVRGDQAQDILLDACGVDIDDVRKSFLAAQKDG